MPHILAVDDDDRIRRLLAQYLTKQGYIAIMSADAVQARAILKHYDFDICILDIMMPGEDGLSLSDYIQKAYAIPILHLTAKTDANDRIAGLESGADDYLAKPFEPKELLLRIQAILRRTKAQPPKDSQTEQATLSIGQMIYDLNSRTLLNDNEEIALTDGERNLFHALILKANMPVRREMLAAQMNLEATDRAIDVQMTRLRKKIEADPSKPQYLLTLRGKGYMVKAEKSNA